MKIIYIAGPFSGDVENNIKAAISVADKLRTAGVTVICVHENGLHNDSLGMPYEYWINATLEIMRRCDGVQLIDGWEKSSGTRGEVEEAKRLGMPVFMPEHINICIGWAEEEY